MALAINGQTQYNDGDARGPVKGNLILGDDGVNIQSVAVDATGHLQVDVLSGGTTGTQYADGAPRGTATGTLSMGDDGVNIQSVAVDSSGHLQVDVLSGTNIDVDVVSGGGGTQYADGAVRGTATGTLMMVDDGVNIQSAAGTAAGLLKVDLSESGGNPIDINVNTTGNVAINDGANDTIKATVLDYVNSNPLAVRMTDTNGDYVAAGAGTQYADGAARGTATGTLSMGDDGVNIQSVAVDTSGHLQVDVLSGTNIDVDVVSGGGGTQYADGAARGTATGTLMMVDDGVNIQSAAGTPAGLLKVDLSESGGNPIDINVNTTGNVAINDGANDTIKATVLDYVNSNPLAVRMTDTNGDYVAAGAGTQYADGAARGTATGTLSMGDDGVNIQSVAVDTSGHLQVDVLSGTNIDVDVVSGGGGTQYADGAARGTATGTLMMVDDGVNIQSAAGTAAGLLKVDLSESGGNPIDINVNTTGNVAINDGANDTIKATVLDYVNSNPLAVRMTDTNGDYVAAGAGTQYADGAARGTATGTLSMGDDGVNIQSVAVDTSGHLQVDVLSGTNIDVDVVSGGGGTQYADGAARGTATGTLMMVDDGVNIQSAAGTPAGLLKVDLSESGGNPIDINVNTTGNVAINDGANDTIKATVLDYVNSNPLAVRMTDTNGDYVAAGAGTQYADGAARGTATGTLSMGDDGVNIQSVAVDTSGHLQVDVLSGTNIDVDVVSGGGGTQYADGAVRGTATGTLMMVDDGVNIQSAAGTVAGLLKVEANAGTNLNTSLLALEAGGNLATIAGDTTSIDGKITTCNTGAIAGTVTANQSTASNLKNEPAGNVAHDAVDSGNPIKIGGRAETTFQAAVSDGDRVDALFDVYGQLRTRPDHVNSWSYHENSSNALTDAVVQAAPGAGLSVYITDIVFSTGAATACNAFLEEGAVTILGPYYLEAINGRGCAIHFMTPKKCTANTAVTVTTSAAIAHGLDITGFISP